MAKAVRLDRIEIRSWKLPKHWVQGAAPAGFTGKFRSAKCRSVLFNRGMAQYANETGLRCLLGGSSLNSNGPSHGWQLYRLLGSCGFLEFETEPAASSTRPNEQESRRTQPPVSSESKSMRMPVIPEVKVPRLLKAYLAIGPRDAAELAWSREFRTIGFLTQLDIKLISRSKRNQILAPLTQ